MISLDSSASLQDVDRAAAGLLGASRIDEAPGVTHIASAFTDADGVLRTIKINPSAPKSELDWLLLHLCRARADAVVITGKILRDEPTLTYRFEQPTWGDALSRWRVARWGLTKAPVLLVLTSGRNLRTNHPVFDSDVQPTVFTTDRAARRHLAACSIPVVSDATVDVVKAIAHLKSRQCRHILIECGPTVSQELYDADAIDEVWLSEYLGDAHPDAQGGPLPKLDAFTMQSAAKHTDHSGPWRFSRRAR